MEILAVSTMRYRSAGAPSRSRGVSGGNKAGCRVSTGEFIFRSPLLLERQTLKSLENLDWACADKNPFSFSSVRLLLTNTLVPRDTKSLVAGVSAKRLSEPHVVDPILDDIQAISDEARGLLGAESSVERAHLVQRLQVGSFLLCSGFGLGKGWHMLTNGSGID